jgi:hypothetical protein
MLGGVHVKGGMVNIWVRLADWDKLYVLMEGLSPALTHLSLLSSPFAAHGRKADLSETAESNPDVYARFVRYVALRELVRKMDGDQVGSIVKWE